MQFCPLLDGTVKPFCTPVMITAFYWGIAKPSAVRISPKQTIFRLTAFLAEGNEIGIFVLYFV